MCVKEKVNINGSDTGRVSAEENVLLMFWLFSFYPVKTEAPFDLIKQTFSQCLICCFDSLQLEEIQHELQLPGLETDLSACQLILMLLSSKCCSLRSSPVGSM